MEFNCVVGMSRVYFLPQCIPSHPSNGYSLGSSSTVPLHPDYGCRLSYTSVGSLVS